MEEKIIVIGSPGAGKSTFSRKLHEITALPLYYLDMIFWHTDKTTASREEFDAVLDEILRTDRWIIDGNYSRTIPKRLEKCDRVFLLDLPLEVCLDGVQSRIGKPREDLPWQETGPDEEFLQYIRDFHTAQLPEIKELVQNSGVPCTVFHSHAEIDAFTAELSSNFQNQ